MTQISSLAVAHLPTQHSCNYRLFQSWPHAHRDSAHAFLTATHAKGLGARLKRYGRSQQGQSAHVQPEGPDISKLDPALQQQWDHAANAQLGNIDIKPYSSKEVWWTCDQCPDGYRHSWSAQVQSRSRGNECPQCSGRQVCRHNSLATKAPWIAAQWDYEGNDGTPDDVVAHSWQMSRWHCKVCGRRWKATPAARVSKQADCKQCVNNANKGKTKTKHPTFAECDHPLLAEWDRHRNAAQGHFPDKVSARSAKQIFWLCTKCPAGQEHSWSATPFNRTGRNKSGCPFCVGRAACKCNSLQALYPDTAAEWDYNKNEGQPSEYTASSGHLAWWSCPQRGSWPQTIHSRTNQVHQKAARLRRIQQRQNSARPS
ncbi:hypothetical protein ABBQ38_010783 [Trebouxia sp. C0009 RCD-2024]